MTTFLTILAVIVVLICIGIAVATTNRCVKLSKERAVLAERLDVLGNLLAPSTGKARPEMKLVLARNYLKGLRVWAQL